MESRLYTEAGIIDLTPLKFSTQENNSRLSDKKFSKIMLPFEFFATPAFIEKYGDYTSYEAQNLRKEIPCLLEHENKIHEAKLFIESIYGLKITAQIDYGFEELPNFDKKLSELPYEKFSVTDIHTYAREICYKSYPATNFNFPRIYTSKYSPDNEVWKNFDGYINDLKPDGSEMRRNYIDGTGAIFNVNIIHPCPHPLYILKLGLEDAGLSLGGEILEDENLLKRWVFSNTEVFSRLTQRRLGLMVTVMDYYETYKNRYQTYPVGKYHKTLTIPKTGKYQFQAQIRLETYKSGLKNSFVRIKLNNVEILHRSAGSELNFGVDMELNINKENSTLQIIGERSYGLGDTETFVQADLFSKDIYNETMEGEDNGVITNLNEINLAKAVPNMTFGEYVNALTNWFNYDIEIVNKTVIMNKIGKEVLPAAKDFTFMEIPRPKRVLLNEKSFLHKFIDLDEGYSKNSMYYDGNGSLLNGKPKSDTNTIEVNGYAMEVKLPKPGGYLTANVMKDSDSVVALVEYTGIVNNQNNATYSPGCDHPELFERDWKNHFRIRVNGQEFFWRKTCSISQMSRFSIKDFIYCYNNIHVIKSINKDKISPTTYQVEMTTETVV